MAEETPKATDDKTYIDQLETYIKDSCPRLIGKGSGYCRECGGCPITFRIREGEQVAKHVSKTWKED